MFIYNVTVSVDLDIEATWKEWMKKVHVPEVLSTGWFTDHKFLLLRTEGEDDSGRTYAIQYFANEFRDIEAYLEQDAARLRAAHHQKFGNAVAAFRTILEEV